VLKCLQIETSFNPCCTLHVSSTSSQGCCSVLILLRNWQMSLVFLDFLFLALKMSLLIVKWPYYVLIFDWPEAATTLTSSLFFAILLFFFIRLFQLGSWIMYRRNTSPFLFGDHNCVWASYTMVNLCDKFYCLMTIL